MATGQVFSETTSRNHFHMTRLVLLFILSLCPLSSFAAVYKCELNGGKTEYQSTPCANSRSTSEKVVVLETADPSSPPAASSARRQCVGKELRINFSDMPLKATLQVLADFSGNKLVADASISGSGAFSYECTPWGAVLQDIASRHNLIVKIENGTIFARKR